MVKVSTRNVNSKITSVEIVEEATPAHLRCSYGGCPGLFKLSDGDLLVIGKALSAELLDQIRERVADDEFAIKISSEYFRNLFK